jgi:NADPH-dependent glutamate synthase beta subunit-like oxidoreductase
MLHGDITPVVDLTGEKGTGPFRTRRPVYACPAGEHIQAWLALAQAGKFRAAWEALVRDNPLPAVHGRVCYHPCERACNREDLDAAVNIHAVERFLGGAGHGHGLDLADHRDAALT